eukprot:305949_1
MVPWMIEEFKILNEILQDECSNDVIESFKYDYFGGIIILISMMKSMSNLQEIRIVTHGPFPLDMNSNVLQIWLTLHGVSHSVKELRVLFGESIAKANKLK